MKISFDLDGVLYPWHISVWEYCLWNGLTDWDYDTFWENYKEPRINKILDYLVQCEIMYSNKFPDESIMDELNRIAKKHEIFYITARPHIIHLTTEQYLNRYNFPFKENLIFEEKKILAFAEYEIDMHIDDRYVEEYGKYTNFILLKQPFNKMYWDKPFCVPNLYEFLKGL